MLDLLPEDGIRASQEPFEQDSLLLQVGDLHEGVDDLGETIETLRKRDEGSAPVPNQKRPVHEEPGVEPEAEESAAESAVSE